MDKQFRKVYIFKCEPRDIWDAFLDGKIIEEWLGSEETLMKDTIGYKFKWRVGAEWMEGKVVELVRPYKKIHFDWRREQWEEGKFAQVVLEINEMSDETRLEITITKIPKSEWDEVYEDWDGKIIPELEKYLKKLHKKKKVA